MADDMLSSPDPLNDSPTFHGPFSSKARRYSPTRRSLPPHSSSPTKQMFELDVGGQLSPQKIRVTVEAGDSEARDIFADYTDTKTRKRRSLVASHAPRSRQSIHTTTTTVPLKGASGSEYETQSAVTPKRGRGRPRKSNGTPVPSKKRGRPSTSTRRSSLLDLVDDDSSAGEFGIGSNVEVRRRKGTSRPRPKKKTSQKSPTAVEMQADPEEHISSTASKKSRPRRKTMIPQDVQILEDHINDTSPRGAADEDINTGGSLRPIDPNSPSKASFTRSFGNGHEDILIAKFHPGHETPTRAGWSSPRVADNRETMSPESVTHDHSPYNQRLSFFDNVEGQSTAPSPQAIHQQSLSPSQDGNEEERYEGEDGVREMGAFDTIMVSEEFSMISVDSVSSLWAPRTSSGNEIQGNKSTEQIADPGRLPTQQIQTGDKGNSFGAALGDRPETTTPQRGAEDVRLLSVRSAQAEDSFSSIAPQVLKAATPAGKSHINNVLLNNNSRLEDSFSDIASEVLEAATPGRAPIDIRPLPATIEQRSNYEDSFSVVPSVVLDAATPAAKRQEHASPRDSRQAGSESGKLTVVGSNASLASSHPQNHTSPRLLTPEETPSPLLETLNSTPGSTEKVPSQSAEGVINEKAETEPHISDPQVPSSPPAIESRRYAYGAQHRQLKPSIAETPFITFSSPSLPPPMQKPREERESSEESSDSQKPTLSPIARAGRALQDLIVPSQPRSRSQSLGSPFNSPVNRKSPSVVQGPSQPPSQGLGEKLLSAISMSSNLSPVSSQKTAWAHTARQDDPFNNNNAPGIQRSPSFEERSQYSLGLPGQRRISDPVITNRRSINDRMQSDDVISWQADEEVSTDDNVVHMTNTANSPGHTMLSSGATTLLPNSKGYSLPAESMQASTNIDQVASTKFNKDAPENDQGADEDFDLLLETMDPSSPLPYQQEQPKSAFKKPRRSKIPSPWWKNSRRLAYSDELSHISSPTQMTNQSLAGNILGEIVPEPVTVQSMRASHRNRENLDGVDLSKHRIPQKANFQPRVRETESLDLSSLLGGSPGKLLPVLSTSSKNIPSQVGRNPNVPQSIWLDREKSSDPIRSAPEDRETFIPIPQKQGFNPRVRSEASEAFEAAGSQPAEQSNFGLFDGEHKAPAPITSDNTPSSLKPLAAKRLSTDNIPLSHSTPSEAPSSPPYLYDDRSSASSNMENENLHSASTRTLQWAKSVRLTSADAFTPLPVSPTKSCLRSPLKTTFGKLRSPSESPSKGVTFASSSPTPSSPIEPLSPTTWSKAHWLLLDSIVQSWKPQNQYISERGSSVDGSESMKGRRRNSTRVISRLLGRRVHSNGDSMVLKQWHLEAVDEFRGQVPGWEEKVIALRVFSLLVGEQRRLRRTSSEVGNL